MYFFLSSLFLDIFYAICDMAKPLWTIKSVPWTMNTLDVRRIVLLAYYFLARGITYEVCYLPP